MSMFFTPQGWFADGQQPGQSIDQPLTGQLIGCLGEAFPKMNQLRRLYFPTLDPTAVTCSLSVLNIE